MTRPVLSAALLSALALVCLTGPRAQAQDGRPPPPSVVVAEAVEMALAPTVQVPGTVLSQNDARIASEIAGRAVEVAEVGARVDAGDVIAQLDTQLLNLQVRQAQSTVTRLEANLGFLNREVARFEELASRNNAPARSVDEAEVARDVGAQELEEARIALERARINLARASVRAPFTGQIVERLVEVGEFVSTGSDVARLVDMEHVDVRARVPVRSAPYVREGDVLGLQGPGNQTLDGPITTLVRAGDAVTRTFEIRVAVPAEQWVIGTPVRVAVPAGEERQVIAVPRDALVLRQAGTAVFRVTDESTAERVLVDTGTGSGTMIEVRGALSAGDRVVVRGAERLRDGQALSIIGPS